MTEIQNENLAAPGTSPVVAPVTAQTATPSARQVVFQDWGVIDYAAALQRQIDLVDLVHQELSRDTVVLCSHPAIVTLGRATRADDLCGWTGPVMEVSRGGRATYHGPSQLVAYPILDLNQRGRNVHGFMRKLEEAIILTLADFQIKSEGRTLQTQNGADEAVEATGVWMGSRKIASIGIGVRKWTSFHGLALNIDFDANAFQGVKPCGFTSATMISMEEILGSKVDHAAVKASLKKHLTILLTQGF